MKHGGDDQQHEGEAGDRRCAPAKAPSMMASLEKKPAVPMIVAGMPTPVSASVPMTIIQ